jgi:hypothetical protein
MDASAVRKTVSQYCQLMDDGRIDDVARLFAEDGVLEISAFGVKKTGRAAIADQFRQTSNPNVKGMHCTLNPVIEIAGSTATGSFDYLWVSFENRPRIGLGGRYVMSFIAHGGGWLIREMKVEVRSDLKYISE